MSSFIIEDRTINKLINFFINCTYSNEEYKPTIARMLKEKGYILEYKADDTNPHADKLGKDLKKMNLKAYDIRYNNKISKINFKFEAVNELNIYQILKSLQCYIYQCSEGEIINEPLYIMLGKIEKILINYIVMHLDNYIKAEWE